MNDHDNLTLAQLIEQWRHACAQEGDTARRKEEAYHAQCAVCQTRCALERVLSHRLTRAQGPAGTIGHKVRDTVLWAEDGRIRVLHLTDLSE